MGKSEQIKRERKIMREQQRLVSRDKQYRNRIFMYGFVAGAVTIGIVAGILTSFKKGSTAAVPQSFASNSASTNQTLGSPLALPSDIKITIPSPSSGL